MEKKVVGSLHGRYRAREYGIEGDYGDSVGTCAIGGCRKAFVSHE